MGLLSLIAIAILFLLAMITVFGIIILLKYLPLILIGVFLYWMYHHYK